MSELLDDAEYANWAKGPVALKITRSGVTNFVELKWKEAIRSWPGEEIEHLSEFLEDIHNETFTMTVTRELDKTSKSGNKPKVIRKAEFKADCDHELCLKLAEHIKPKNPKNIVLQCSREPGNYPKGEECYWDLAKMFMLGQPDETTEQTCPDNTEPVLVFKMMKNCDYLFVQDDEQYEKIFKFRNSLMHSPTYKLTSEELHGYVTDMKYLLRSVHENECKICEPTDVKDTCEFQKKIKSATNELDKLLAKKTPFERTKEDLEMVKTALEEQRKLLEWEKKNSDRSELSLSTLDLILEANKKRTNEYTVFITKFKNIYRYDNPCDRKKAYEEIVEDYQMEEKEKIKKEEESKQKLEAQNRESEERKIKKEVDKRVHEEIDRIKKENDKKQQEEERRRKGEEKRREEIEKRKREEEDRKRREEERMRREAERRKREEEERKRIEEEKRRREEEEEQKANERRKRKKKRSLHTPGAAIGGTIGMAGGPVGAAVGGTVGAFIGGLFGGT